MNNEVLPLPGEHWKTVAGHEDYLVSNLGRVKSLHRPVRIKRHVVDRKGYCRISLQVLPGVGRTVYVHRLVALAFVEPVPGKPEVNHRDGDPRNNRAQNLEWVTHAENLQDALRRRGGVPWNRGLPNGARARAITMIDPLNRTASRFESMRDAVELLRTMQQTAGGRMGAEPVSYRSAAPNIYNAQDKPRTAYGYWWAMGRVEAVHGYVDDMVERAGPRSGLMAIMAGAPPSTS